MNYAELKQRVLTAEGVETEEKADGLIRAIAGHLVGRVDETLAHDITGKLPEPLTFDKLRGHQIRITALSTVQYIEDICRQFRLTPEQAREVIRIVLHSLKGEFSIDEIRSWESEMPEDWVDLVEQA